MNTTKPYFLLKRHQKYIEDTFSIYKYVTSAKDRDDRHFCKELIDIMIVTKKLPRYAYNHMHEFLVVAFSLINGEI